MTDKKPATSIEEEAARLLRLIKAFSGLLLRETAALKAADFKAVDALQADKRTLTQQYHAQVTALAERRAEIAALGLPAREKIIHARTDFTVVLADNMRALDAAKDSARRIIERIIETARDAVIENRQTHYSSKGRAAACKSATMSLSVDQSL